MGYYSDFTVEFEILPKKEKEPAAVILPLVCKNCDGQLKPDKHMTRVTCENCGRYSLLVGVGETPVSNDDVVQAIAEAYYGEDSRVSVDDAYRIVDEMHGKWYGYEEDMTRVSNLFPNVFFTLERVGEESPDIEILYLYNGKSVSTNPTMTVPVVEVVDGKMKETGTRVYGRH